MNPGIPGIHHIGDVGIDVLGNVSIRGLAALKQPGHPAMERVAATCSKCGAPITASRFFAPLTACDACIEKHLLEEKQIKFRDYWHEICPPGFRDTKTDHPQFPRAQWELLKEFAGKENLLFYGPSRTGKTRVALHLLKRCLLKSGMYVSVLWPEQLKDVKHAMNRLQRIEALGRVELLLLDDALLTGAQDERLTDFLKDLIDYRLRQQVFSIITSQIGSEDYIEQAGKFEQPTKADLQRVKALLARIKESYRVISFVQATPVAGEAAF
jgi:hypothetical protein